MRNLALSLVVVVAVWIVADAESPPVDCGPMCMKHCRYGNMRDSRGCSICRCVDPCKDMECPVGQMCSPMPTMTVPAGWMGVCQEGRTDFTECSTHPLCRKICPYGFETDTNGCAICECMDPCEGMRCGEGRMCKPERTMRDDMREDWMGRCQ